MSAASPYTYDFDIGGESTAAKVCRYVGEGKEVLELGCAYGVMTRVLSEHYRCRVFGVEYDAASAASAEPYCDELRVADIEQVDWAEMLGARRFDVIVAADILEHLADPLSCLTAAREYLKPGGYMVLSIPNVAHNGIVAEMFGEDFCYRRVGLLDNTHRRFFAYESVRRLLSDAGLRAKTLDPTRVEADRSEFAASWQKIPEWLKQVLRSRPIGDVYQFVLIAEPVAEDLADGSVVDLAIAWEPDIDAAIGEMGRALEERRRARDRALSERDSAIAERDVARLQLEGVNSQLARMLGSWSWRITRPARVVARLVRREISGDDLRRLVDALRPWYRRLPIPAPMRQRLSGKLYRLVARCLGPRVGPWTPPDASIRLAPALPGMRDYVVFGIIDWHFRHQRPQHLAQQLAAHDRRVFYVSVNFIDAADPGFAVEPLDGEGRLFSLRLHLKGAPSVYDAPPGAPQSAQLRAGLGLLLGWAGAAPLVALVQHPFWFTTAVVLPNSRLVYDCMDHHEGFGGVTPSMLAQERALLGACDLTVTTSSWIDSAVLGKTKRSVIVRNAADFDHFATAPVDVYRDPEGRPIIGYYGAIADWFDIDLVAAVAGALPHCAILLIGADTVDAHRRLARYRNVTFLGEIAYPELPRYAHAFAVCLLPFKVLPLTLATNPVKVYEYLSMGKPVVSTDLPEIRQLGALCRVACEPDAFVAAVREGLVPSTPADIQARQEFAQAQTWAHRVDALLDAAESVDDEPLVSVVVVTYNNLELTKQCLASIDALSDYPKLEVIVVDNASADASPEWLRDWARHGQNRQLILNDRNLGFAAANNQGLRAAHGEYLIMLNNDTHVTPGWVRTMVHHMRRDATLGLLGPVTNNIGNEARIDIAYGDMAQMIARAGDYTRRHMGSLFPLRTAAFFCVMLRRETFEKVGPLDEAFGRGFFEDDDYCRRVEAAGLRVVCAEDVFVHHHLSASFNKLKHQERQKLFEENKRIYEAKWGAWVPHSYRDAGDRHD